MSRRKRADSQKQCAGPPAAFGEGRTWGTQSSGSLYPQDCVGGAASRMGPRDSLLTPQQWALPMLVASDAERNAADIETSGPQSGDLHFRGITRVSTRRDVSREHGRAMGAGGAPATVAEWTRAWGSCSMLPASKPSGGHARDLLCLPWSHRDA